MLAVLTGMMRPMLLFLGSVNLAFAGDRLNVLYIISDDLRPQLGCYGANMTSTPNIDRFAGSSLVFDRAFCQYAVCGPSRNSFMTGRRPDTTRVWGMHSSFRTTVGQDWIPMPEHFKKAGYLTLGGGKTYHPNEPKNWDEPRSWSQDKPYYDFEYYIEDEQCPSYPDGHHGGGGNGTVTGSDTWCPLAGNENLFYDEGLANHTISLLEYAKTRLDADGTPFFIACGFARPHVPYRVPAEIFDRYMERSPPAAAFRTHVGDAPPIAYHQQGYFNYSDGTLLVPTWDTPLPVAHQQVLRAAYYASVTWMDEQFGRVLGALDALNLTDTTVIAFHGDHGFQLGEHDSWHKNTNWELGVRTPLIIRAPNKPASAGQRSGIPVELIDVFPTLADLAGSGAPHDKLDGVSLAPLFEAAGHAGRTALETSSTRAAFSQYERCNRTTGVPEWEDNSCGDKATIDKHFMGYSIRTTAWRYTAWVDWGAKKDKRFWSHVHATELYDHRNHVASSVERRNVVASPGLAAVVAALHAKLIAQFPDGPVDT